MSAGERGTLLGFIAYNHRRLLLSRGLVAGGTHALITASDSKEFS